MALKSRQSAYEISPIGDQQNEHWFYVLLIKHNIGTQKWAYSNGEQRITHYLTKNASFCSTAHKQSIEIGKVSGERLTEWKIEPIERD